MFAFLFQSRGKLLQAQIALTCCSGFYIYGYDAGVFSGSLVSPYFLKTFHHPSALMVGLVSSLFTLGGAVGAAICVVVGNSLGRKLTIQMGCVFAIVGALIEGLAKNMSTLIAGRLVSGIGLGQISSTVGILQAETSSARHRGMMISMQMFSSASGLFLAQWINYGFGKNGGAIAFMFPLLFQIVVLTFSFTLAFTIPESPRWLVATGRLDEAARVLARLGTKTSRPDDTDIQEVLITMEQAVRLEHITGLGFIKSIFHSGPTQLRLRLFMSVVTGICLMLAGLSVVTYYVPIMLTDFIGVSRSDSLWIGGLVSVVAIVFAIIPIFIIDRVGRLLLMKIGSTIQGICFFAIAGLYAQSSTPDFPHKRPYGIAIVSFVFIYFGAFCATWNSAAWVYAAEILPIQGRSIGMGISVSEYLLCSILHS
ncbi:uncharacterized protein PV07_01170 [Cladophialophora immunda]|uniref:Major facilitator superfamily (MFS) profile domain-containing protein n=1 Tax=Cladophialophora immunda TaxID=569365 RepID=A0A0D2B9V9_9EURO|nr:uncharacterized protein PV07_01170 [Cladophialophora immunda]KIW34392.1 hypothetical protein PV07_01170 [Cladophialophora immunda]